MSNAMASITRAATRKGDEPLNILCMPTHERIESNICRTGHRFWAIRTPRVKDWNTTYAPLPSNYVLLNPHRGEQQIPAEVSFDLVFSQNKAGQFQIARSLASKLHLPLVSLEHTLPHPSWTSDQLQSLKAMRGDVNVFISEYSRDKWGWSPAEALVIHHGIDTDTFSPNDMMVTKKRHLLSVVNDWKNRDWCCGYELWRQATRDLPVFVVGATPGLSQPARSVPELVMRYREAQIFVNTSLISPVPTALLEAMACGCAVVSTSNCMIPEVITHGVNGLLGDDAASLAGHCRKLLDDAELCRKLGAEARRTIQDKFSLKRFMDNWNRVFRSAANITYTGVIS